MIILNLVNTKNILMFLIDKEKNVIDVETSLKKLRLQVEEHISAINVKSLIKP